MSQKNSEDSPQQEPTGFTQHSGGLASEYAREQGWGLNEEERSKTPEEKQDYDGGTNYEYGARDFRRYGHRYQFSGKAGGRRARRG